jgi:hypothetical protein
VRTGNEGSNEQLRAMLPDALVRRQVARSGCTGDFLFAEDGSALREALTIAAVGSAVTVLGQ